VELVTFPLKYEGDAVFRKGCGRVISVEPLILCVRVDGPIPP
jgi:hypothetical protein